MLSPGLGLTAPVGCSKGWGRGWVCRVKFINFFPLAFFLKIFGFKIFFCKEPIMPSLLGSFALSYLSGGSEMSYAHLAKSINLLEEKIQRRRWLIPREPWRGAEFALIFFSRAFLRGTKCPLVFMFRILEFDIKLSEFPIPTGFFKKKFEKFL